MRRHPQELTDDQREHLRRVRLMASEVMLAHGLDEDWYFAFNQNRRRVGLCKWHPGLRMGRIELSIPDVQGHDLSHVRSVLLHEAAHGIVGPGRGHDDVFWAKCLEIGGNPEPCAVNVKGML